MENYKVRVENIAEADYVQQLFENIGYKKGELVNAGFPKLVVAVCDRDEKYSSGAQFYYSSWHKCQELTIDQLRNLVAAKTKKTPYLVKTIDKWEEQQLTSDTPESATCLKIPSWAGAAHAYGSYVFFTYPSSGVAGNTVWQRQTQPEELPFIDDDPKMADIEQTLNERQSQYGDFPDVADTTQSMYLMLLNDDMTDVEREALHMICSKLSRIKHGDCHRIDSWHDIGGYATLVVKDLEQNNG